MKFFAIFAVLLSYLTTALCAESVCPLCALILNDEPELISHIIYSHPVPDKTPSSLTEPDSDASLAPFILAIRNQWESYYNNSKMIFDSQYHDEMFNPRPEYFVDVDYGGHTITFEKSDSYSPHLRPSRETFHDCGALVMLLALHDKNYSAALQVLEKPDGIASLDIVDEHGNHVHKMAEKILEGTQVGTEDYEHWHEITTKLAALFAHARIKTPVRVRATESPDFLWRRVYPYREVEEIGWRQRSRREAIEIIDPSAVERYAWWGPCTPFPFEIGHRTSSPPGRIDLKAMILQAQ